MDTKYELDLYMQRNLLPRGCVPFGQRQGSKTCGRRFRAEKRSAQFFCAYPFAGASELKRLPFDSVVVVEQWLLW